MSLDNKFRAFSGITSVGYHEHAVLVGDGSVVFDKSRKEHRIKDTCFFPENDDGKCGFSRAAGYAADSTRSLTWKLEERGIGIKPYAVIISGKLESMYMKYFDEGMGLPEGILFPVDRVFIAKPGANLKDIGPWDPKRARVCFVKKDPKKLLKELSALYSDSLY